MVEVVYVCSPKYWRQLFLSIRSLYASGSDFDKVRICVTSEREPKWEIHSDEIEVDKVPDIGDGFWMLNKTHLCSSEHKTVVFLDVDTVVLGNIGEVYSSVDSDVIARCAPRVKGGYFDKQKWERRLSRYGCSGYPYLSSGFVVFQNGAQKKIRDRWVEITKRILRGEGDEEPDWHANQDAFSIACCLEDLSLDLMDESDHAYAMLREEPKGATVYHLGMPNFYHYYFKSEQHLEIDEEEAPVPRPRFLKFHRFKNRLSRKLKRTFGWNREATPDWSGN